MSRISSAPDSIPPMAQQTLDVRTTRREELVDITPQLNELLRASKVSSGLMTVYCPHTTAGITINENSDPDVREDMLLSLRRSVPREGGYRHAEGNADAHMKASLVGASATVPVEDGMMLLGHWQAVFLCEFDGPRNRKVIVQILHG
jgi:secondary thiamine-phosphate synthase enzyme